jgi:predicted GNAT family N-acyltransferase
VSIRIVQPQTAEDFTAYYQLRWEVLRAPWNQPPGSEKDEMESDTFHLMAVDDDTNAVVACGRWQMNTLEEAQIRFMAVATGYQGKGVGKKLMAALESELWIIGAEHIVLHAREIAVPFYLSCGYSIIKPSYLLFGEIPHFLMQKAAE